MTARRARLLHAARVMLGGVSGGAKLAISLIVVACSPTNNSPGGDEARPLGGYAGNPTGGLGGAAPSAGAGSLGSAGTSGSTLASGGLTHSGGSTSNSGGAAAGTSAAVNGLGGTGGGAGSTAGVPLGGGGQAGAGGVAEDGGAGGSSPLAGGSTGGSASVGCDWSNPEGKIVLFDGSGLGAWQNGSTAGPAQWRLVDDGSMEVVPMNPSTNIQTSMRFEDLCLHLEYMTPMYPANVTGQQRGNSGIYFKRSYEMQVLDSYDRPPEIDGCGAVYDISPPIVVACNMQLVWNTYEIEFRASRWDGSRKTANARFVLATLNGKVVQRNVDLDVSMTTAGQADAPGAQPLALQDHGNPVRFRNIWVKVPGNQ